MTKEIDRLHETSPRMTALVKRFRRIGFGGKKRSAAEYKEILGYARSGMTYEAIGGKLGVSREQARILHYHARAAELAGLISTGSVTT